jgi:hypothetical protein
MGRDFVERDYVRLCLGLGHVQNGKPNTEDPEPEPAARNHPGVRHVNLEWDDVRMSEEVVKKFRLNDSSRKPPVAECIGVAFEAGMWRAKKG